MKEYIVEKKQTSGGWTWVEPKGELIRCKDCKYYNPQQHYCEGIGNWFGYVGEWSDNGYCYKAERKEE